MNMYPHFIISDCSLLLNPKQAGCVPLFPPRAVLGLSWNPAVEGAGLRQNK